MGKMSELAIELDEQAGELGFCGLEDALDHGWRVNYELAKLEPPVVQPSLDEMKALEKAHEEWLKEKAQILEKLEWLEDTLYNDACFKQSAIVHDAINFIRKGDI